jgi:2-dehydro-3-deoxy-D-gluconate 5-dehydrogenase
MILEAFKLDGRTALVTGASSGIGQAMAVGLAEAGADIVSMSRAVGEETARQVRAAGRSFRHYDADFTDRASVYRALAAIASDGQTPDILVNNAGTIMRAPAAEHPDEYLDEVLEINLKSQFIVTREIGRGMLERGRGKIIFTCSLLTFQGGILVPSYAASKGGVGRLVMAFANEWAGRGVNVNGIAPGYVVTEVTQALRQDPARAQTILSRIPAGRWGDPRDFAGPVVFLASSASDYIHGAIIMVDGGWMGR